MKKIILVFVLVFTCAFTINAAETIKDFDYTGSFNTEYVTKDSIIISSQAIYNSYVREKYGQIPTLEQLAAYTPNDQIINEETKKAIADYDQRRKELKPGEIIDTPRDKNGNTITGLTTDHPAMKDVMTEVSAEVIERYGADAKKALVDQYTKQYGGQIPKEELNKLLIIETDPAKINAYLKSIGLTPEQIKEYELNIKNGGQAVGMAMIDPKYLAFGKEIGCDSPSELLKFLGGIADAKNGLSKFLNELKMTADVDPDTGEIIYSDKMKQFIEVTKDTQTAMKNAYNAIYELLKGNLSPDVLGKIFDENGVLQTEALMTGIGKLPPGTTIEMGAIITEFENLKQKYDAMNVNIDHILKRLKVKPMDVEQLEAILRDFATLTGVNLIDENGSGIEFVYKGQATDNLNTGIYMPVEVHTYLARIDYKITKEDKSKFDKQTIVWDKALMEQYVNKLNATGGKSKEVVNVYTKWIEAVKLYNSNYSKSIPVEYPTVNMQLANGNSEISGSMDFEAYLKQHVGGTPDSNVNAQDFIRNYFSDISSGTYSSQYRGRVKEYYKLFIEHDDPLVYNRINDLNLSYLACPIAFNLNTGKLIYGYEIYIVATLKQIVNYPAILASDGNSENESAVKQLIQYYPYRQYILKGQTCKNIGTKTRFTGEDIINNRYIPFNTLINKGITDQTLQTLNVAYWKDDTRWGSVSKPIYFLCEDEVHSNLNLRLFGINEKVASRESGTKPTVWDKTLHLHTVKLGYVPNSSIPTTCETAQKMKTIMGMAINGNAELDGTPFAINSTDVNSLVFPTNLCDGYIFSKAMCAGIHKTPQPVADAACSRCGKTEKGFCKNHATVPQEDELKPTTCTVCGSRDGTPRVMVSLTFTAETAKFWVAHKNKCIELTSEHDVSAGIYSTLNYAGLQDASTEINYPLTNADHANRLSEVKPYQKLKWFYKGKIIGDTVIFDPVTTGAGAKVENFISM